MRPILELLRAERHSRPFFVAHAQSSLGTGAAYVGLLLLAYDRLESPWALSLVLLADFLPGMFLGPLFGAAADRWSRRWCAVVADALRAAAFIALAFFGSFELTILFALLAGIGTALYGPAVMAGLPSLVSSDRLPAATSLYGVIADLGYTVGPALAALGLLVADAEGLMLINGITFGFSALLIARLPFGDVPPGDRRAASRSLLAAAREGIHEVTRIPGVSTVIAASSAVILFAGLFNVAEFLLVTRELGAGSAGFSALVASFGLGVAVGSLVGSRGGTMRSLKRRYLTGLWWAGLGFLACAVAPNLALAALAFGAAGVGNGLVVVHERLLLQGAVSNHMLGRVFGLRDTGTAWGFAIAFVAGGGLLTIIGSRDVLLLAGIGGLVVAGFSALALKNVWPQDEPLGGEPLVVDGLPVDRRESAGPAVRAIR